jgi:hypothetical protein
MGERVLADDDDGGVVFGCESVGDMFDTGGRIL